MKTTIKYIAPWLAAAAIGGAIGLAPIASAAPATTSSSHDKVVTNTPACPHPRRHRSRAELTPACRVTWVPIPSSHTSQVRDGFLIFSDLPPWKRISDTAAYHCTAVELLKRKTPLSVPRVEPDVTA